MLLSSDCFFFYFLLKWANLSGFLRVTGGCLPRNWRVLSFLCPNISRELCTPFTLFILLNYLLEHLSLKQAQPSSIFNTKPLRLEKWSMRITASAVQTPATQTHTWRQGPYHLSVTFLTEKQMKTKHDACPDSPPLLWARCKRELTHQMVEKLGHGVLRNLNCRENNNPRACWKDEVWMRTLHYL